MHGREMTRDRLPRTQESVGGDRHAIEPHTSAKDKVALKFVRELAERLQHARVDHAYDKRQIYGYVRHPALSFAFSAAF